MATDAMVSVIVVNYNAGSLLVRSVATALESSVVGEVIVVDNASTDSSLLELRLWAAERPDVVILENLVNLGFARANNRAVARAGGQYLLFLNPDNILAPGNVEAVLSALQENPAAGMAGCLVLDPDGNEQRGCRRNDPRIVSSGLDLLRRAVGGQGDPGYDLSRSDLPAGPVEVEAISGSYMLVQRAALDRVGLLDEGYFLHCEDLDWCRRFREAGYKVLFVPHARATHYQGRCSATEPARVSWYKHRGMIRYYRKFGAGGSLNPAWLVMAVIILGHFFLGRLLAFARSTPPDPTSDPAADAGPTGTSDRILGQTVVVAGAGSMLAGYLLPHLVTLGYSVVALSRSARRVGTDRIQWYSDVNELAAGNLERDRRFVLVSLAPLWALPDMIRELAPRGLSRVIGFSSTSISGKRDSADPVELELVRKLENAESESRRAAGDHKVALTLLRPTMIYSGGGDQNISAIARFVRRYRFFPLPVAARGLREPVHAGDLARACGRLLGSGDTPAPVYNLGGGERLTYRDMVHRIFVHVGRRPVLVPVPRPLLAAVMALARMLPGYHGVSAAALDRMNGDLVYDQTAAHRDLDWHPHRFLDPATC